MDFILRTYTADPNTAKSRSRRRNIIIGLSAFCVIYGLLFAFFAPYLAVMFAIPPAAVALLAVWALPEIHNPPTKALERLFFALILFLAAWPGYLAIALPGLPWITVVRLADFPMVAVLLICLSTSASFRSELGKSLGASRWIATLIAVFFGIQLASILPSHEKGATVNLVFVETVMWTCVFFVSSYVFLKPGRAIFFARLSWGIAVFVCLIGLVEWKMGHVPWYGHVPKFLQIQDPLVALALAGQTRSGVGQYRIQSIFDHPTTLSEYLAIVVPFVFDFAVRRNKLIVRIAAAATVAMMAFVVYLTNSRTGSIGFLVAFLAYGFLWSVEQRRTSNGGLLGAAVFYSYPVAAFIGTLGTIFIGRIHNVVWGGSETLNSTIGRETQWKMGMPLIEHNPIGHGVGTSGGVLQYREPNGFLTVDSFYLTMLLDVGVVGFLVFYTTWIVGLVSTGKTVIMFGRDDEEIALLAPVTCTLINFVIIKSVFSQIDNHPLVYAILGMGVALMYRAKTASALPALNRLAPAIDRTRNSRGPMNPRPVLTAPPSHRR